MSSPFAFDVRMSRDVMTRYLSRALTVAYLTNSATLDDDIRMFTNVGAKFLGRAALVWTPDSDDDGHFRRATDVAAQVHAADPEIMLQAAIFEAVSANVALIPIPAWVFEEFELPVEPRTFSYAAMLFPDGRHVEQWGHSASAPDIRQTETQLWFYYRARRYLDAGYEALHLGQVHLYGSLDRGYRQVDGLLARIRRYAAQHARRHLVLIDAHTHGIAIHGRLLFDVHAIICFLRALPASPQRVAIVPQGESLGGVTPNGWTCRHAPYLKELDNYGGSVRTASPSIRVLKPDGAPYEPGEALPGVLWPWGYDEIGWFANQPAEERNAFLRYAWRWFAVNDPNGHFQAPGRRGLGSAKISTPEGDVTFYQANRRSDACPHGFGQEATIKALWAQESPIDLMEETYDDGPEDPATGFRYPAYLVLAGELQAALGARAWDTTGEITRLDYAGDGVYRRTLVFPVSGDFRYRVTVNGSWTENYGAHGIADGDHLTLHVPAPGTVVEFRFDYPTKTLTVKMR